MVFQLQFQRSYSGLTEVCGGIPACIWVFSTEHAQKQTTEKAQGRGYWMSPHPHLWKPEECGCPFLPGLGLPQSGTWEAGFRVSA